ncbi:MAG TPA: glycosyltransferase family 2 protein [Phycisphaerae bacterium]|nr:glycosyltransferase family 2 protein [Phycisphaerae bacterium]
MRILTAIPVFNEAKYVTSVLNEVRPVGGDILVIDDGSTDQTPALLAAQSDISVITHPENRGYGQSLIDAFAFAERHQYDWIVTIDCDDQHEPAFIPSFLKRAREGDVDIVSGSRYLAELPGNTGAPDDRRRINQRITCLINETLGYQLTDAFCGFKAYRVSAVSRLDLSIPGYAFPLQFWVQAYDRNLAIAELPVARIYNDPNRHFGGMLDDPEARLRHYLDVFNAELTRIGLIPTYHDEASLAKSLEDCTSSE